MHNPRHAVAAYPSPTATPWANNNIPTATPWESNALGKQRLGKATAKEKPLPLP